MNPDSPFKLVAPFSPTGDQPEAIRSLLAGLADNAPFQTLEGVTGSGKTFTMANVIAELGKPTLIVSHNKTLAAQLYGEMKEYFPENAVEFFVSYYDYYQPEAYIPQTDTFIEKDSSINEEIERLRLSATNSLLNRKDVIIVASVSCIYGLGSPQDYRDMVLNLQKGEEVDRQFILRKLVDIQYTRNDYEHLPGTFRVRGDTVDVYESYIKEDSVRIEFFGDEVERISRFDPISGRTVRDLDYITISPARHFVMPHSKVLGALDLIRDEVVERVAWFEKEDKLLEAQRIKMRTDYDLEMMTAVGFCSGIENYSRHLSGREEGERPATLIDYFQGDFLTLIDESHVSVPQIHGMYNGDRSRKTMLVDHGFRLPSALDNRPLRFDEFDDITGPMIFISATPGPFEREHSPDCVPQLIRPTGIVDPPVEVRPLTGQIDDLMEEVRARAERKERVLVSTLTKRTAEDLTEYLHNVGLRVQYLHSEIDALQRVEILRGLRNHDFDCLIGINLLREGLDLPEVSLVAILDADKEGFLRSETSLIQTSGRAARHLQGKVILYADKVTDSMKAFLDKTDKRRYHQLTYNDQHGIVPQAIVKKVMESLGSGDTVKQVRDSVVRESGEDLDVVQVVADMEKEMLEAAERLQFERAAILRDQIQELHAVYGGESKTPSSRSGSAGAAYYKRKRKSKYS